MSNWLKRNWRVIENCGLSVPFIWLLVGALLQSHECNDPMLFSGQNMLTLCNGTHIPDWIKDGFFYDVVFLRGGSNANESHWISTVLLCVMYFGAIAMTKQFRFSFIFTVFFGEFHETLWSIFEYIYNRQMVYGGENQNLVLFWIFAPAILLVLGLFIYFKFFFQWGFLVVIGIWLSYLEAWWYFAGLHVTVLLNGLSPYYSSAAVNQWENGGWLCIVILALGYLAKYKAFAVKLTATKRGVSV